MPDPSRRDQPYPGAPLDRNRRRGPWLRTDGHRADIFRCQTHLAATNRTPVRHWIEIVDEALG
ncbi:hypothetical protein C6W89_06805 [Halomonas sp. SYSU XM8]|nr:hypothetical protein C6W89_06805 [Halomonas sp. SYSU XM8]